MMATYYPGGSEIQADHQAGNLQTLYLMNPNFSGYPPPPSSSSNNNNSDTHNPIQNHNHAPPQHNMFFLNHSGSAHAIDHPTASSFNHAQPTPLNQQQQHLVGIPLASSHHHLQPSSIAAAASSSSASGHNDDDDPNRAAASIHEIPAAALHGLLHYNLWSAASPAADMSHSSHSQYIPTAIAVTSGVDVASSSSSYMGLGGGGGGFRRPPTPLMSFQQHQQQGGLSLSLNNSSPTTPKEKLITSGGTNVSGHNHNHNHNQQVADVMVSSTSGGGGGVVLGSKYLKAAQELLDEVVNVEKAMLTVKDDPVHPFNNNSTDDKAPNKSSAGGPGLGETSGTGKTTGELSTAQRQELQMKKTKLLNMLDEVEQRYRQYHAQMQIVVSSFEQVAGEGAARSYTALALQTISKQFRCLKDAIASQIKATSRSLGDAADDNNNNSSIKGEAAMAGDHHSGGNRLRLVDHHLRQQRALQQLGMVQHNAWRPQRGLPERAVSVLRAWLFEHFLHPYPKDSDKHMLAKQTGLTRSQVSNWFINARVRLWKPMVEEMYLEEIKAQGHHHDHHPPPDQTQTQNNNDIEDLQNTINNNIDSTVGAGAGAGAGADATTTTTSASTNNNNHLLSNSTTILHSPTSISTGLHHGGGVQAAGFSFVNNRSSSDQMDSILNIHRMNTSSPKRQRSGPDNNIHQNNSPTSIISMEMEMKPLEHPNRELIFTGPATAATHPNPTGFGGPHTANYPNNNVANEMIGSGFDRLPDHNHLTIANAAGQNHHHHRYNLFQGNGGVSLTLGLPHCENQQHLSLSGSGTSPAGQVHPHHNFIIPATPNNNIQLGRTTLDNIDHHHDFSDAHQPSHSGGFTTTINDLHVHDHTRKRFAAHQLLPDFVT